MSFVLPAALTGNQSIASAIATPIRDATIPIANIRPSGCLGPGGGLTSGLETDIGARCYSTARRQGAPPRRACRSADHAGAVAAHGGRAGAAEARRRSAVMAPERLGELGRLAVADVVRHLADGQAPLAQEIERAPHAHARYVAAEARLADLREGALELAPRGRKAPRDVVELERLSVLALDDLLRLL